VRGVAFAALFGSMLASGCAERPSHPKAAVDPALERHILDGVPSNIPNRAFIDFEGKLHLIGYAVEPEVAAPGTRMKVRWYWHCVSPLGPGWSLFTHVLDERGVQVQNVDNEGPLRRIAESERGAQQSLPPSAWQPGKVYVDEQEFQLAENLTTPEIILAVGVWRGESRLAVISGPSDRGNRGLVTHLKTGIVAKPRTELAGKT
jgi:hypothetical protein